MQISYIRNGPQSTERDKSNDTTGMPSIQIWFINSLLQQKDLGILREMADSRAGNRKEIR
jgi:hypothetical protein